VKIATKKKNRNFHDNHNFSKHKIDDEKKNIVFMEEQRLNGFVVKIEIKRRFHSIKSAQRYTK
jgi:hypothetical protein